MPAQDLSEQSPHLQGGQEKPWGGKGQQAAGAGQQGLTRERMGGMLKCWYQAIMLFKTPNTNSCIVVIIYHITQ